MSRLKRYFFVGLVVITPVGVTVLILGWIFGRLDAILGDPLRAWLGFSVPGLGFILLALLVLGVGWVVHNAIGRRVLSAWNLALVRFPVAGRLYNAASQIVQSVVSDQRRIFRRTVLIPYPTDGLWAIAFVTHEEAPLMSQIIGEACIHVFVPTTPNPTSGFLLIVPRSRSRDVDISVEDAMKLVISAGSLSPVQHAGTAVRRGLDMDTLFRDSES